MTIRSPFTPVPGAEPERYELHEVTLRSAGGTTRRQFLKVVGGGAVVVLVARPAIAATPHPVADAAAADEQIAAWLHIAADGAITVYTGKVEFGQGVRTSLAQELAQELHTPLESVRMVMGDTDLTPFDRGTFGSRSTPQMGTQLRKVGAAARNLLIGLAAQRWKIDRSALSAADGRVTDSRHPRSAGYGELAAGRRLTAVIHEDEPLTAADHWTVAGRAAPRVGARDLVTGRHRYPSDITRARLAYGKVLRPRANGSTLAAVDTSAAAGLPDVTVVQDGDFVGAVAPSSHAAAEAVAAIQATWTPAAGPQPSSETIFDYLRRTRPAGGAEGGEGRRGSRPFVQGDVETALSAAAYTLGRTYTVAYIAHTPLEPRAAVAEWTRGDGGAQLTVWTGTQRPFGVRSQLMEAFGLRAAQVRVIVPDTGSGYGGKHTGECAIEAARLARAAGRPVKLQWTREEEFRWAYFRPAGVIDVRAGVQPDGTITAWTFDNYNSGASAIRPMYAIANQRIQFHPSDSPLRQGSYRGLAATANHFAREMHVDELSYLVRMDPLAFRCKNLDDARLIAVFRAAAARFGWGRRPPADHGVGIGGGFEKGGYVATCAEVAVDRARGGVRVVRAVTAFDCGAVVNPDLLRNQIAGALIQGIGGALFEAIDFSGGVIRNAHLAQYRVPRFADVPAIDVVLVNRPDQPSFGAGETPIMAIAPAIGAAIFDAVGVRPRGLPMARGGLDLSGAAQSSERGG